MGGRRLTKGLLNGKRKTIRTGWQSMVRVATEVGLAHFAGRKILHALLFPPKQSIYNVLSAT
jgi:hypothetical protein